MRWNNDRIKQQTVEVGTDSQSLRQRLSVQQGQVDKEFNTADFARFGLAARVKPHLRNKS